MSLLSRLVAGGMLAAMVLVLLAGASTPKSAPKQPDKLIILSTTDVKGKTSPCG
jgi:hypothetical protein